MTMSNDFGDVPDGMPMTYKAPKNRTALGLVKCSARPFAYALRSVDLFVEVIEGLPVESADFADLIARNNK